VTKKEALIATCQASVPDGSLELALINKGLTGTDAYSAADQPAIELCAIDVLNGLLAQPDVTEGGYSVRFDRASVQKRVLFLAQRNNVTAVTDAVTPKVRGASPW
jgi:hypothetical protein